MAFAKTVWYIFMKDIRLELRSKESISSIFIFSLAVMVILHFGLDPQPGQSKKLLPSLYWITLVFGGLLRLSRTFENEKEDKAWYLILTLPLDRSSVYLGKFLGNLSIFIILEILLLPLFLIFFDVPMDFSLVKLFLVFTGGMVGLSALGTTIAAVSMNLKMRELMLPVLLLPLFIPVLIGSVEGTAALFQGGDFFKWLQIVFAFDLLYLTVSMILFEYILT